MNKFVFALLFICPKKLLIVIPSRFRYLFLTASHSLGIKDNKVNALLKLNFPKVSADLVKSFAETQIYYVYGEIPAFDQRLESVRNESYQVQNQTLRDIIQWSFWTLNHKHFDEVNAKVKSFLVSLPKTGEELRRRYLPQHITNMGHLAMLFLYINYYRKSDPHRIIVLPKVKSANDYYLNLIIRHSPLKIEFVDPEEFLVVSPKQIDTLHYSFEFEGRYRTEADCAFFADQDFPEFNVEDDFNLKLNEEEQLRGRELLESILERKIEWFVALHVREPKNSDLRFSQARDANISNYSELAQEIEKNGGLVIRMGDKNFPKLNPNFPAFDYAYSQIKSEFMDVWLWANCRLWIGTINGAAFPPITFSKPRLLTDQWYWYENGPARDFRIQKRLVIPDGHDSLPFQEWRLSRCMSRVDLANSGAHLQELSKRDLKMAFKHVLNQKETLIENSNNIITLIDHWA